MAVGGRSATLRWWHRGAVVLAVVAVAGSSTVTVSAVATIPPVAPPTIVDLSPTINPSAPATGASGRVIALTQSGITLYASGEYSGLFKSTDAGATWQQLTYAVDSRTYRSASALPGPVILDASADPADPARVLAVSARNDTYRNGRSQQGVYLSVDGGASWGNVWVPSCNGSQAPPEGVLFVSTMIAVAWGGCQIAYSTDGGATWPQVATLDFTVYQVAVDSSLTAWACGQGPGLAGLARTSSLANTRSWADLPNVPLPPTDVSWCGNNSERGSGAFWHSIAINPGDTSIAYVAETGAGPARIVKVDATTGTFTNLAVPGPTASSSGVVSLVAKAHTSAPRGFILVFGNTDNFYVADGEPPPAGTRGGPNAWYPLGVGRLHPDTHAVAIDPGFDIHLSGGLVDIPATLGSCPTANRLFLANDGGVFSTTDCGATWSYPQAGLSVQAVNYFAMVPRSRAAVELGFGVGDDGDFLSVTGGATWVIPVTSDCADCGDWFSDPGNATWLLTLARCCAPGDVRLRTFSATTGSATPDGTRVFAPGEISNYTTDAPSPLRPVIQTMPGERSTARDMVWVTCCDVGRATLIRSSNPVNAAADRRLRNLPAGQWYVQTSGGHTNTHYFLWNASNQNLLRWVPGQAPVTLFPHSGAATATRFWVDPYDPAVLYLLDAGGPGPGATAGSGSAIKRFTSHGWVIDRALTTVVTNNGEFTLGCDSFPSCGLNDLLFVPGEHTRFAAGKGGVFMSLDGTSWTRLFTADQIPGNAQGLAFDVRTRSLYVGMNSRGLIRIDGVACPSSGCPASQ